MPAWNDEPRPLEVPIHERIRRLPGAILLTAGYYAERAPLLRNLLHRPR